MRVRVQREMGFGHWFITGDIFYLFLHYELENSSSMAYTTKQVHEVLCTNTLSHKDNDLTSSILTTLLVVGGFLIPWNDPSPPPRPHRLSEPGRSLAPRVAGFGSAWGSRIGQVSVCTSSPVKCTYEFKTARSHAPYFIEVEYLKRSAHSKPYKPSLLSSSVLKIKSHMPYCITSGSVRRTRSLSWGDRAFLVNRLSTSTRRTLHSARSLRSTAPPRCLQLEHQIRDQSLYNGATAGDLEHTDPNVGHYFYVLKLSWVFFIYFFILMHHCLFPWCFNNDGFNVL